MACWCKENKDKSRHGELYSYTWLQVSHKDGLQNYNINLTVGKPFTNLHNVCWKYAQIAFQSIVFGKISWGRPHRTPHRRDQYPSIPSLNDARALLQPPTLWTEPATQKHNDNPGSVSSSWLEGPLNFCQILHLYCVKKRRRVYLGSLFCYIKESPWNWKTQI